MSHFGLGLGGILVPTLLLLLIPLVVPYWGGDSPVIKKLSHTVLLDFVTYLCRVTFLWSVFVTVRLLQYR